MPLPASVTGRTVADHRADHAALHKRFNEVFDPTDPAYGAVGDGVADDVTAINLAATAAGVSGGTVIVPPGTYLVNSSILLPSNVTLHLMAGATIVRGFTTGGVAGATIRNSDQTGGNSNVAVTGTGTIKTITSSKVGKHIGFKKVDRFAIRDVNLTAIYLDWNINLVDCTNGTVSGLYINSGTALTEDGLNIAGGSGITVSNCFIKCGDDALAIVQESNYSTTNCSDIVVSNCYLYSAAANAINIQTFSSMTPSNRSIKRVSISNCVGRGGYDAVIVKDGTSSGLVTDIEFNNVIIDASGTGGGGATFETVQINAASRLTWHGVRILDPYGRIRIEGASDISLVDCESLSPRGSGAQNILMSSSAPCTNVSIIGGHYKGATQHAIETGGTFVTTDLLIQGVLFENPTSYGIDLAAAVAGARVTGCRVKGGAGGISTVSGATLLALTNNDLRGNTTPLTDGATGTYRCGNRLTAGALSGRAVMVNGTVTVSTVEVQTADNIALTRVVAAGTTRGVLTVGTITAGTSFVIRSEDLAGALSADDDSTVFWEIVH